MGIFRFLLSVANIFIKFADANMKLALLAKSEFAGMNNITYSQAKSVVATWAFDGNTDIESFDELQHFKSLIVCPTFSGCSNLQSITIPDNITTIPANCFYGCIALDNITLDWDKITNIGVEAFKNCNNLPINSITFGVNSVLSKISSNHQFDGAFKGSSIKNITINNTIMTVLGGFKGTSMTSVVAPNVTSINPYAFHQGSVTNIMSFPNVKVIGENAFYQTSFGNNKIDLYNIVKFSDYAFWRSVSLRSLGDNFNWSTVKYIGIGVFNGTRISMPRELYCKIIGHQAFNLNGDATYPNVNNKSEKYIILRFDGSDISDINDYPTGTNGQDLIRKGVVGFIPYLNFKQSPFGDIKVVYIPDSEPDENNKTIKDYYLESIWGQLIIGTSNNLLSFRTYSEGEANDGLSIN